MSRLPTILCVDDEPIVLTSLREQFERGLQGLEVEVAQDAAEALEILEALIADGVPVPVVISDHIMPGMKGDELLVHVHRRLPDTRTVLLTGQAGLDAVGRAVNDAGLYRYLTKPWQPHDLTMTLREAVRAWQAERQVRAQQLQLAAAHAAATRFVPYEFLSLLGRTELAEVRRGDCTAREVAVYYSDIRSFTSLVEGHTPAENLEWINEYLGWMEPPIHRHGGFVAGVAGDAVIALFGTGADAVLGAAIESFRALDTYNTVREGRGEAPLRIGIGLAIGECLMGVIGGEESLKCGVIGDAANLASRVEGLTKHIGPLLITEEIRDGLADPDRYAMRYVDRVRVKGRSSATTLYEVLDALPEAERLRKLATADRLTEALTLVQAGDLKAAAATFDALAAAHPDDPAFAWHRERVAELAERGLPADWDGVTRLHHK